MKLLLIDNFDSFTYNLAQYFGELGATPEVVRNNAITLAEVQKREPSAIVISPGPGTPDRAGITLQLIRECAGRFPMLGVCLGHQAIVQAFGGRIVRAPELMHGKTSQIFHNKEGIFRGVENPMIATRYHSLIVDAETVPPDLVITAKTQNGIIMALAHGSLPIYGVQFHPESILTREGKILLKNFLQIVKEDQKGR